MSVFYFHTWRMQKHGQRVSEGTLPLYSQTYLGEFFRLVLFGCFNTKDFNDVQKTGFSEQRANCSRRFPQALFQGPLLNCAHALFCGLRRRQKVVCN